MQKIAEGYDAVDAVTSPMAHMASSAAKSGLTGAGIGTVASLILTKGKKGFGPVGIGSVTGGTLGALSGAHESNRRRHMAMQAMGLEAPKMASVQEAYEAGRRFALEKFAGLSPQEVIKQANALSDAVVGFAKGFDEHVMHNVGRAAAGLTHGAGHVVEGIADLNLEQKVREGGRALQDFGKKGMDRVVWGRTLTGIAGAGLAYEAGKEIADTREMNRRLQYYGNQVM